MRNVSTPAIIVELIRQSSEIHQACLNGRVVTDKDEVKHNDRNGAAQIVNRKFVNSKYDDMLLVAVSYDKKTKEHQCRIERLTVDRCRDLPQA